MSFVADARSNHRAPPTVPEGTARLRIALTLNVDEVTVANLFEALSEQLREAA
jgi:8-amino-7-oxononanoate synthase